MPSWKPLLAGLYLLLSVAGEAGAAQTLRIGLADDPDMLDPSMARTFTGRVVFAALCDKLLDISPELDIVPQLATEWQWTDGNKGLVMKLRRDVRFHDGEPFDAAAVKSHYRSVAEQILRDLPLIYLWHDKWLWAATPKLAGFTPYPDGLIRPQGMRLK